MRGVLELVRARAVELKRALFDKELMYIYREYLSEVSSEPEAAPSGAVTDAVQGGGQA